MAMGTVQFLLNNEIKTLGDVNPNLTILQYLRDYIHKTGSKEGCASGDCGACTVVIAELDNNHSEEPTKLSYKSINACITFVGSLHGKQLITVEDLKEGAKLHHVQQTMVDHHASQCGFCTPGFVMSSFALHKNIDNPNREEVLESLAGNLCRCTGYRSIIDAAIDVTNKPKDDSFSQHYQQTLSTLININALPSSSLSNVESSYISPKTCDELSRYLITNPSSTLVAGGTDLTLAVTQHLKSFEKLVYLGNVKELNEIEINDESIKIGSAVTYEKFTPLLNEQYSDLGDMIERIGSMQIRNNGTLGGNVGNASPIGDMPPALISLGCTMVLQKGDQERCLLVEDYFVDYKKTVLAPSEFIKSFTIPKAKKNAILKVYKISKRIDDDISAVLASIYIEMTNDVISSVRIAFGGMAAIPKRAKACEAVLLNQAFTQQKIDEAKQALLADFKPMSDVRASDKYRMLVAQNLLQKFFIECKSEANNASLSTNESNRIETRVVNYA